MAKKYSSKSNYPSRYSPNGWVSPQQYIVEILCENVAKAAGNELPIKFWELPEWEKTFKSQIPAANKLLKQFPIEAIIKALKSWEAGKIYSLRAPWLPKLIQKYVPKTQELSEQILGKTIDLMIIDEAAFSEKVVFGQEIPVLSEKDKAYSRRQTKKGILSKLEEIDGEEKGK